MGVKCVPTLPFLTLAEDRRVELRSEKMRSWTFFSPRHITTSKFFLSFCFSLTKTPSLAGKRTLIETWMKMIQVCDISLNHFNFEIIFLNFFKHFHVALNTATPINLSSVCYRGASTHWWNQEQQQSICFIVWMGNKTQGKGYKVHLVLFSKSQGFKKMKCLSPWVICFRKKECWWWIDESHSLENEAAL